MHKSNIHNCYDLPVIIIMTATPYVNNLEFMTSFSYITGYPYLKYNFIDITSDEISKLEI